MKDMLLSLQSYLFADFFSLIHKFTTDLHNIGDRVHYIKNKMDECTTIINDLVDVYEETREDHTWIKAKLVDL